MDKTIHNTFLQIRKTANSQISKLVNYPILFLILFLLWGLGGYAQTFNWDWAVSGGGAAGDTRDEQIYDVKVGTDNNYYFIAPLYGGSGHQLDGQSLPTYNVSGVVARDILLFSTTCDGTIRWSHVLGGGSTDQAYNLVLDSQNNVYIGINMGLGSTTHQKPVYFSPTDSLPLTPAIVPSDYYKNTFLVKFGSTGQYLGKKALQGAVGSYYPSPSNFSSSISDLAISNDTLYFIVGLQYGLHLDDNITVPSKYYYDPFNPSSGAGLQYHLAKYDTNLNYINSMLLPIADNTGFRTETTRFVYDQNLDRYYLAGMRSMNVTAALIPLTYGGKDFVERDFVLAIDGTNGNELWRREFYTNPSPGANHAASSLTSLSVDANSDVYVTCRINRSYNDNSFKIYDPNNQSNTTYNVVMTPLVWTNLPYITKFNNNGVVQWVKIPSGFANSNQSNNAPAPKGLALKSGEVAFGSSEGSFEWDGLYHPAIPMHRPDPALLRLDKQTGDVIGLHGIPAGGDYDASTAVAVDKDGNYVVGGFFYGGALFPNTPGIAPLNSAGESDFFVAKLAAYACGTNSTQKFNTLKINVYPNPTNDVINIETDEQLSNYIIYDVSGRQIQSNLFAGSNQINLQNVTTGVYFIKVTTMQGNSGTVRVVKK